jgi:hypothetical protein
MVFWMRFPGDNELYGTLSIGEDTDQPVSVVK